VSIDYRLLHHFRISQRREMAARGELPARFQSVEPPLQDDEPERPAAPGTRVPRSATTSAPPGRGQVLTHLLNEDR
jgi:hypothetical protein